jgi:hypothetical protein
MKKRSRIIEITTICIASFAISPDAKASQPVAPHDPIGVLACDVLVQPGSRVAWGGFGASAAAHCGAHG